MIPEKQLNEVKEVVWKYYREQGRHTLPWRKTKNPYHIVVSEIMLQQTQVFRVVPKYKEFMRLFPTCKILSQAPLRDVLIAWQGLGYNRRAKKLHELSKIITHSYRGVFPKKYEELLLLPSIGPYTASAICAFAYDTSVTLIETNIRTVLLYHFFPDQNNVHDKVLLPIVERLCDQTQPKEWYWALMDYGSYLKKSGIVTHRKSIHYVKQSAFKGSMREIRGAIIRVLSDVDGGMVFEEILKRIKKDSVKVQQQLIALKKEKMIHERDGLWSL